MARQEFWGEEAGDARILQWWINLESKDPKGSGVGQLPSELWPHESSTFLRSRIILSAWEGRLWVTQGEAVTVAFQDELSRNLPT